MTNARLEMTRQIAPKQKEHHIPSGLIIRSPAVDDRSALAELMLDAYHGNVDDEGGGLEDALCEVDRLFGGAHGEFLFAVSFVVQEEERLLSASLITSFEHRPLIAFLMTCSSHKRQGLGTVLLERTCRALYANGERLLRLFVTAKNTPAVSFYKKHEFETTNVYTG